MVTHETYQAPDGAWLAPDEVAGGKVVATGEAVTVGRVEKMSKSKKNTVDPGPIVDRYGADAVRWFMLSDSPPERDLPWSEAGIEGAWRFVQRLWRIANRTETNEATDADLDRKLHRAIAGVAADVESLSFNKAVAKIHSLASVIEDAVPSASRTCAIDGLMRMIAPMLPHLAEEAWALRGNAGLIADAAWPAVDPALLVDDEVTIAVQVNGKLRDTLAAARGGPREALEAMALGSAKVQAALAGATPRKVIVVPDRLVNIVA